jgi:Cu/Ag efflux protein CusF
MERNVLMTVLRFSLSLLTGLVLIAAASAEEARGRIVQIDSDNKELQLEIRGPLRGTMLNLTLGSKTQIFIGRQVAALGDLTPGWRIRVVFEQRDGKAIAQVIRAFGLGRAQPQPELPTPRKEGDGVTGTLQRVALTDHEVVLIGPGTKGPRTETTLAVPPGTPITRDGKAIAFDALKEGETATVKVELRNGRLIAMSIQVGQASAAPAVSTMPRRNVISRLRKTLKQLDEVLREIEAQRENSSARP